MRDVAALAHEAWYDAVEWSAYVSKPCLAHAQGTEVLLRIKHAHYAGLSSDMIMWHYIRKLL